MLNEKTINKVREILSKFDAEDDGFTYDIHKHMEYVRVYDKITNRAEWIACYTILLMPDLVFKRWRAE